MTSGNTGEGTRITLFICTGNTARSQMAECLLRERSQGRIDAQSAGLSPRDEVHPLTIRVFEEIGIDASQLRPKGLNEYLGKRRVRHAIAVCDPSETNCPRIFPFALETLHWPFPDPTRATGDERQRLEAFRTVRDRIAQRIEAWWVEQGP